MDILLTSVILLLLLIVISTSVKYNKVKGGGISDSSFMSLSYTNALKAISCIIVVIVHIPVSYGNILQDLLGSFAYIGVTLFFLISAYGCSYGVHKNGGAFLKIFWFRRIIALFIPSLLVNALHLVLELTIGDGFEPSILLYVNGYVWATMIAYFIFWIVWVLEFIQEKIKDYIIILLVIVGSILTKFTPISVFQIWPTESLGFAWGILLFRYKNSLVDILEKQQLMSIILTLISSVGLGVAYLLWKETVFFGDYLLKIALGISLILFIFSISIKLSFEKKPIQFLGNISYEIYLLHGVIMTYLAIITGDIPSGYFILLTYLFTIMASVIVFSLAKPIIEAINKLITSFMEKISQKAENNQESD